MHDYKHSHKWRNEEEHPGNVLVTITLIIIGIIMGAVTVLAGQAIYSAFKPAQKAGMDCRTCHGRIAAYTQYFKQIGSKQPQKMAEAVLSTKNPRLMAAIAKIESNGNPDVKNTGYKHRHSGAFQVSHRHGRADSPVDQALLAELVLEQHLAEEKSLTRGLNAYGGESDKKHGKYARAILAELQGVPK